MNKKALLLLSEMLELASSELSNNGCHDWHFPKSWSKKEKQAFVKSFHEWNGDPEEYDPNDLDLPDWAVASYLSHLVKEMANAAT